VSRRDVLAGRLALMVPGSGLALAYFAQGA